MKFRILNKTNPGTAVREIYEDETTGQCAQCGQSIIRVNLSSLHNYGPRYRFPGDTGPENVSKCKECGADIPENFIEKSAEANEVCPLENNNQ